jgi:hypothetical protein
VILLISSSSVARITDLSYQCLAQEERKEEGREGRKKSLLEG